MIFVTVGAQMPFDRLVRSVDAWAGARGRKDVFAQIGADGSEPRHIEWVRFLEPHEFRSHFLSADVVVTHAGMGTILTALELGKPIVVMPRLGRLHETRNDHQVATAERFGVFGGVHAAADETVLEDLLDHVSGLAPGARIAPYASPRLLGALHEVVAAVRERRDAVRRAAHALVSHAGTSQS